jgi:hypothetical protein
VQTVFLHIGQTKTATTTLQTFMYENRGWLATQGVFYPEVPPNHALRAQHRFLVNALYEHRNDFSKAEEAWSFLREQICHSGLQKAVISEEVFWHLFEQSPARRAKAISWIQRQLGGFEVKVICYVRRQDHWIESWYNQIVKTDVTKASKRSIEEFVAWHIDSGLLNYNRVLGEWADAFGDGNVILHAFEPSRFLNGNVIHDFCSILGIHEFKGVVYPEELQASLTNAACDFSLQFNRSPKARLFKEQMSDVLSEFAGNKSDRRRYLPATLAKEILALYEPSNQLAASRFMRDGEELFMDKVVARPKQDYPGISAGELSRIVVEIFIHQQSQIQMLQNRISELEMQVTPRIRIEDGLHE